MPKYEVIIEVDGERHIEEVSGPDCKLAMNKALKLHPVKVLSITPLEEQLDLDRDHHPGQAELSDDEIAEREEEILGAPFEPGAVPAEEEIIGPLATVIGGRLTNPTAIRGVMAVPGGDLGQRIADEYGAPELEQESITAREQLDAALEAELAAMRGPDGTDESGLDS